MNDAEIALRERTLQEFRTFKTTGAFKWLMDTAIGNEQDGIEQLIKAEKPDDIARAKIKIGTARTVLHWMDEGTQMIQSDQAEIDDLINEREATDAY